MSDLLPIALGAAATLAGVGVTGLFGVRQQHVEDRRAERRSRDETIDAGLVALTDAEYIVSIRDIRARAARAGHDIQPYLDLDDQANHAFRQVIITGRRLRVRAPEETALHGAYDAAHAALDQHHRLVRKLVEGAAIIDTQLAASREQISRAIVRYGDVAARLGR